MAIGQNVTIFAGILCLIGKLITNVKIMQMKLSLLLEIK